MDSRKGDDSSDSQVEQLQSKLEATENTIKTLKMRLLDDLEKKLAASLEAFAGEVSAVRVKELIFFLCQAQSLLIKQFPKLYNLRDVRADLQHTGEKQLANLQQKINLLIENLEVNDYPLPSLDEVLHHKKAKRLIAAIFAKRAWHTLNNANQHEPTLAIPHLKMALQYQPNNVKLLRYLALQQLEADQNQEAINTINRFLLLDCADPAINYAISAKSKEKMGLLSDALSLYTKALQMPSAKKDQNTLLEDWVDAQIYLLIALGYYKRAINKIQKSLNKKHTHVNYRMHRYFDLARVYTHAKQFTSAFAALNKAFSLALHHLDFNIIDLYAVLWKRYDLAMQVADYDLAEESCHLLKQFGDHADFTSKRYVDLYLATFRSQDALMLCNQLISRNPKWEEIYLLRAEAHYQMGLYENALSDLSQFLDVTNGYMQQSLALKLDYLEARIAVAIGHFDIAEKNIASLEQCIEWQKQDIQTLYPTDDFAHAFLIERAYAEHLERYQKIQEFINYFASLKASRTALINATATAKFTLSQVAHHHATLFSSPLTRLDGTAPTENLRHSFP